MKLSSNEKKIADVSEIVEGKKVVLFGTGNASRIIANHVPFEISYYVDNDNRKWDMAFRESVIYDPKRLYNEDKDTLRIFIASTYSDDITRQLESMGFTEGIHFWNGCEVFSGILAEGLSIKEPFVDEMLQKNSILKNTHKGKRCFIIGNGPSIATQDLLLLKNDIKIVVNSFYRHPQLSELHPEYWVVSDPQSWIDPDNKLYSSIVDTLRNEKFKTKFFMPSNGIGLLRSKAYETSNIDPHVFHYDWNKTTIEDIDLSKDIPPWGQNTIVSALILAFHLGCENLYLLGCDHDWWGYTKERYEEECLGYSHFYQQSTDLYTKTISDHLTFEQLVKTIDIQQKQYQLLKEYGEKKGQHIYNATEGGLLDIFPRVEYRSLFE